MRSSNNMMTIDLKAEVEVGNIFWTVFDRDTGETLTSTNAQGDSGFEWKDVTLSAGDNWGLASIDQTARFGSLSEATQVAEEIADLIAEEYPEDEINLEIHQVRLEMVEMVHSINTAAGKVSLPPYRGYPEDSAEAEDEDGVSELEGENKEFELLEEDDYYSPTPRRPTNLRVVPDKHSGKAKKSSRKDKSRR